MSIFDKINRKLKEYKEQEEDRENKKLEHLKSAESRAQARAEIEKSRLRREEEISRAKAATRKAQIASRKARIQLEKLGEGSGLTGFLSKLSASTAPAKHTAKRKKKTAKGGAKCR